MNSNSSNIDDDNKETELAKEMVHSFFEKVVGVYDKAKAQGKTHDQAVRECHRCFPIGRGLMSDEKMDDVIRQILKQGELR